MIVTFLPSFLPDLLQVHRVRYDVEVVRRSVFGDRLCEVQVVPVQVISIAHGLQHATLQVRVQSSARGELLLMLLLV